MAVLWILLASSAGSWGITIYKLRQLRRARRESEKFVHVFWESKSLNEIHTASLEHEHSPVAHVFRAGYQELRRLTRVRQSGERESETELGGAANVERAMRRATSQEVTRLEKALTFLATTASTAPFIGLFGTVWGIMNAFGDIDPNLPILQTVTPHIAEALVATAIGLLAAIPAVMAYNWLVGRMKHLEVHIHDFSTDYLNILRRHFFS